MAQKIGTGTQLRFSGEFAHRFDDSDRVAGLVILGGLGGFSPTKADVSRNWGRIGLDVDQKLTDRLAFTASVHKRTDAGQDQRIGLAAGVRAAF